MRFSLSGLFVFVTMLALACAGMTSRTRWWAYGIISLTLLLYLGAALWAIRQRGRNCAMALAVAIVGSVYLLLTTISIAGPVRQRLVTHRALVALGNVMRVAIPASSIQRPSSIHRQSSVTGIEAINGLIEPANAQIELSTNSHRVIQFDQNAPRAIVQNKEIVQLTALSPSEIQITATNAGIVQCSIWKENGQIYTVNCIVYSDDWDATFNPEIPPGAFLYVGHCAWSWLFALLAAWLCGYWYSQKHAREAI